MFEAFRKTQELESEFGLVRCLYPDDDWEFDQCFNI